MQQRISEPEGQIMNSTEYIAVLGLLIALASAAFAGYSWHATRKATLLQAPTAMQLEYRSAEMPDAVSAVWNFYREHKDDLINAYDLASEVDRQMVAAADTVHRIDVLKITLHYKRRFVSSFTSFLPSFTRPVFTRGGASLQLGRRAISRSSRTFFFQ